jgi:hypothetical protein
MLTLFCCGSLVLMVDVLMGRFVKQSVDYGRMVEILVQRAASADEFTRLTSITWVNEFVKLGGEHLVPYYGDILGAILPAISDKEEKIRVTWMIWVRLQGKQVRSCGPSRLSCRRALIWVLCS